MPTPTPCAPPAGAWPSRSIPDLQGGDAEAMRRLNEAADLVLHELGCNGAEPVTVAATRGSASRPPSTGRTDHDVARS